MPARQLHLFLLITLIVAPFSAHCQKKAKPSANKQAVIASIDQKRATLIDMSDQIWNFAEMSFEETNSSKLLSDYAASQGFTVQKGVADIPTAFIASYSSPEGLFYAKLSAASTMAILPILILGWFSQKQLVRGLTFGAVK